MYHAPHKDFQYLLQCFSPDISQEDQAMYTAILTSIETLCQEQLLEANFIGDQKGIVFDPKTQRVQLPEGYQDIVNQMRALGLFSLEHATDWGGLALPKTLCQLGYEMLMSANSALFLGMSLTHSAVMAIERNASDDLKQAYLPNMVSGQWMGSMCLTEPHCGTDLGLIKSKATVATDHCLISGQKIWITFGEHELAENIIHLVLARLPDAPPGSKGISLFLVPKWLPNGTRNAVYCTGVEHKMGTHVSPTCVMQFENAVGWLIGKPHQGLANMFVMMNDARKTVANQGIALAEMAYQFSREFVINRRQSRSLDPKKNELDYPADPILHHPDVRRQLLQAKSTIIALRGLLFYTHTYPTNDPMIDILTPVLKSLCTELGCESINQSLQVMGGSGYVRDWHVEQCYRDARIAMIYEGTNGIQALDFVMRKLQQHPNVWETFLIQCQNEAKAFRTEIGGPLTNAIDMAMQHFKVLLNEYTQQPEIAAAKAPIYLKLVGYTLLTYIWGRLSQLESCDPTYQKMAIYFVEHETPKLIHFAQQLSNEFSCITGYDTTFF